MTSPPTRMAHALSKTFTAASKHCGLVCSELSSPYPNHCTRRSLVYKLWNPNNFLEAMLSVSPVVTLIPSYIPDPIVKRTWLNNIISSKAIGFDCPEGSIWSYDSSILTFNHYPNFIGYRLQLEWVHKHCYPEQEDSKSAGMLEIHGQM